MMDEPTKKANDCRHQLALWSKFLEVRIAIQKVLIALREVEKARSSSEDELDPETIKSIRKFQHKLVNLRDEYRKNSQFHIDEDLLDFEDKKKINDSYLDKRHDDYAELRTSLIDRWYEKTKISSIPKKGYTALELPTSQIIANALKDKERLIRKTQVDRTSPVDNVYDPEIFNDDDFYHHLLKEVVSKDENRRWVELQRTRYKSKRKADTKATKGRKIKRDLIPKLVNFMAPSRRPGEKGKIDMPEQIRKELLKSLFGGQ